MSVPAYSSFTKWYCEGRRASYVRTGKSPGRMDLLEMARPAGDMHRPAMPELVLHMRSSPSDFRRAVRNPVCPSIPPRAHSALEGLQ